MSKLQETVALPVLFSGILAFPVDPGVVRMGQSGGRALEVRPLLLDALHRTRLLQPFRRDLDLKTSINTFLICSE